MFTNAPSAESTPMVETPPLRKFMFDRSFDGAVSANKADRPRVPVTLKPEQFDALKQEAYTNGFNAGKQAGIDENMHFVSATLAQIDARIERLLQNLESLRAQQDQQMRKAVMAIARKILPLFIETNGQVEIHAMIEKTIADMIHEPRLVIRVNENDFDTIDARVTEISAQKAYAGKAIVLTDSAIARGDCRIEWADGGIERNTESTWQAIEKTVVPDAATSTHTA